MKQRNKKLGEAIDRMKKEIRESEKALNDAMKAFAKACRKPAADAFSIPTSGDLFFYRKYLGLTLRDVAKGSGVAASTINRIEAGEDAYYSNWTKICEFYKSQL